MNDATWSRTTTRTVRLPDDLGLRLPAPYKRATDFRPIRLTEELSEGAYPSYSVAVSGPDVLKAGMDHAAHRSEMTYRGPHMDRFPDVLLSFLVGPEALAGELPEEAL